MPEKATHMDTATRIADAISKIPDDKKGEAISFIEGVVAGVGIRNASSTTEKGG